MKLIFSFLLICQFSFVLNAKETTEFLPSSKAREFFKYKDKLEIIKASNDLKRIKGFLGGKTYLSQDKAFGYLVAIYLPFSVLNSKHVSNLQATEKGFHKFFLNEAARKEKEIKEIEDPVKQKELMVRYEKWRDNEIRNKLIRSIKLNNGANGFIQPHAAPGMSLMSLVNDPSKRFDLVLILITDVKLDKNGNPIVDKFLPATKKYLENIDIEKMAKLLEYSLNQIYPEMEAQYRKLQSTTSTNSAPTRSRQP